MVTVSSFWQFMKAPVEKVNTVFVFIYTFLSNLQFWKVPGLITIREQEEGIVNSVMLVFENAYDPILLMSVVSRIVKLLIFDESLNALLPIEMSDFGKTIVSSIVQLEKAESLITDNPSTKSTSVSNVLPLNALEPIVDIFEVISILGSDVQS